VLAGFRGDEPLVGERPECFRAVFGEMRARSAAIPAATGSYAVAIVCRTRPYGVVSASHSSPTASLTSSNASGVSGDAISILPDAVV
jgi:hypothetical protein